MSQTASIGLALVLIAGSGASGALLAGLGDAPPQVAQDGPPGHHHAGHEHGASEAPAPVLESRAAGGELRLVHNHFRENEAGEVPTRDEARGFEHRFERVTIRGDSSFEKMHWIAGSGTAEDPYVIDSIYVRGTMDLKNSGQFLIIRNSYFDGRLQLNYIGPNVYVHHNFIHDLRVNENVERKGTNTGGLFEHNEIEVIGQIRHFIGEFRHNEVGPKPEGFLATFLGDAGEQQLADDVVWNFDGFHGANVHHNVVQGLVDIKLHGHNHGSCMVCPIHNHADPEEAAVMNHQVRYHSLLFTDNTISVPEGYALRYNDRNHAGDDRTANSEPEEALELSHVHHEHVVLARNTLRGGFFLDVFYAADKLHKEPGTGIIAVRENGITVPYGRGGVLTNGNEARGIFAQASRYLDLRIRENRIGFEARGSDDPIDAIGRTPERVGVRLHGFASATIDVARNFVQDADVGVKAREFAETVAWRVAENDFGDAKEVDADESVESRPSA